MQKNSDGTYSHFEMKGGVFAGWVSKVNEIMCRAERSADTAAHMDKNDIDGTAVLTGVLGDIANRLEDLLSEIETYNPSSYKPAEEVSATKQPSKVYVFTADHRWDGRGRQVVSVTDFNPTTEQMWKLLEADIDAASRERKGQLLASWAPPISTILDEYVESDFVVNEMDVQENMPADCFRP